MKNQMMPDGITIQREGGRSYLLAPEEMISRESEEWEQYAALGIRGLLSCKRCCRDGQNYWSYDITGKQSLCDYYREREIDFGDCRSLLMSMDRILRRMYECLLSEEELWLEPGMIYIGMEEKEMQLVYGRCGTGNFVEQMKQFAEYMIEHIDYTDERAVALAHQFYKYASADSFNMGEFLSENYVHLNPVETENVCERQEDTGEEMCIGEEIYYDLWINRTQTENGEDNGMQESTKTDKKRKAALPVWIVLPLLLIVVVGIRVEHMQVQMLAAGMAYVTGVVLFYLHRHARTVLAKKEEAYFMENSGRANPHL